MNQTLGAKWYVRHCTIGVGICLIVYVMLIAFFSFLTTRGTVGEGQLERGVWISAATASAVGSMLSGSRTVKRGAMMLGCAVCFYVIVLLLGFLVGGTLEGGRLLWLLLPVFGGAAAAYLLPGKKNAKRRKGKHRVHR